MARSASAASGDGDRFGGEVSFRELRDREKVRASTEVVECDLRNAGLLVVEDCALDEKTGGTRCGGGRGALLLRKRSKEACDGMASPGRGCECEWCKVGGSSSSARGLLEQLRFDRFELRNASSAMASLSAPLGTGSDGDGAGSAGGSTLIGGTIGFHDEREEGGKFCRCNSGIEVPTARVRGDLREDELEEEPADDIAIGGCGRWPLLGPVAGRRTLARWRTAAGVGAPVPIADDFGPGGSPPLELPLEFAAVVTAGAEGSANCGNVGNIEETKALFVEHVSRWASRSSFEANFSLQ